MRGRKEECMQGGRCMGNKKKADWKMMILRKNKKEAVWRYQKLSRTNDHRRSYLGLSRFLKFVYRDKFYIILMTSTGCVILLPYFSVYQYVSPSLFRCTWLSPSRFICIYCLHVSVSISLQLNFSRFLVRSTLIFLSAFVPLHVCVVVSLLFHRFTRFHRLACVCHVKFHKFI